MTTSMLTLPRMASAASLTSATPGRPDGHPAGHCGAGRNTISTTSTLQQVSRATQTTAATGAALTLLPTDLHHAVLFLLEDVHELLACRCTCRALLKAIGCNPCGRVSLQGRRWGTERIFALLGRRFASLRLTEASINDASLHEVLRTKCNRLQHLSLQRCFSLKHSAAALQDREALRSLRSLSVADMTVDPAKLIEAAGEGGFPHLEFLGMTDCRIHVQAAARGRPGWACLLVAAMPRLRCLFLGGSRVEQQQPGAGQLLDEDPDGDDDADTDPDADAGDEEGEAAAANNNAAAAGGGDGEELQQQQLQQQQQQRRRRTQRQQQHQRRQLLLRCRLQTVETTFWSDADLAHIAPLLQAASSTAGAPSLRLRGGSSGSSSDFSSGSGSNTSSSGDESDDTDGTSDSLSGGSGEAQAAAAAATPPVLQFRFVGASADSLLDMRPQGTWQDPAVMLRGTGIPSVPQCPGSPRPVHNLVGDVAVRPPSPSLLLPPPPPAGGAAGERQTAEAGTGTQQDLLLAKDRGHDAHANVAAGAGAGGGATTTRAATGGGAAMEEGASAVARAAINCRDHRLCTPLHNACIAGNEAAARWLLGLGARVDLKDCKGCTPLFRAAQHGHVAVVGAIRDAVGDAALAGPGGLMRTKNHMLELPLYIAALKGHAPVVELLLGVARAVAAKAASAAAAEQEQEEKKKEEEKKGGKEAAASKDRATVASEGAPASSPPPPPPPSSSSRSCLSLPSTAGAAVALSTTSVAPVMAPKAAVFRSTLSALSPAWVAPGGTAAGTTVVAAAFAKMRSAKDAAKDAAEDAGRVCGGRGVDSGVCDDEDNAEEAGGAEETKDSEEKQIVAESKSVAGDDCACSINWEDQLCESYTPLHAATIGGHVDCARLFLPALGHQCPMAATQRNKRGKEGREGSKGEPPQKKLLDWPTKYGQTPAHIAARLGQTAVLRLLLDAGAKVNTRDERGRRPVDIALDHGRTEAVALLSDCPQAVQSSSKHRGGGGGRGGGAAGGGGSGGGGSAGAGNRTSKQRRHRGRKSARAGPGGGSGGAGGRR